MRAYQRGAELSTDIFCIGGGVEKILTNGSINGTFITRIFTVRFFANESGKKVAREWLLDLPKEDRRIIGEDLKILEFRWPVGMPHCKPLGDGLYELRSHLVSNRIARLIFAFLNDEIVVLHAFIKKTQKISDNDLKVSKQRLRSLKNDK